MGFKSHNQVSKTLTVTELPEHQSKKLVPAGEMFDILVATIFAGEIIEVIPIEERCYLRKDKLILKHIQAFRAAKLQNQVR